MTDKINGRTPEEIKKGLEYYAETDLAKKLNACKQGLKYWYAEDVAADALAYIQQLEAKNAQLQELCDNLDLALVKQTRQLAEKELVLLKTVEEFVDKTPKWISVEERLPESKMAVLTYGQRHVFNGKKIEGFSMEHVAYTRGPEEGWFSWDSEDVIAVTHWMPLPEPPKEA